MNGYEALKQGGLVGMSAKTLLEHVGLYQKAVVDLAELDAARPRASWVIPPDLGLPPGGAWQLLGTPICGLDLAISGQLGDAIGQVFGELAARGIDWRPAIVAGEPDFWTADQATTINVPWTLANDVLWRLVNDQTDRYTYGDVLKILRHEVGHALGYAFELWRDAHWRATFGDFFEPYRDDYVADPSSADHVLNLHAVGSGTRHYAQKHPDEDWAETFAVWLAPSSSWREIYANWPVALRKLMCVEDLIARQGRGSGVPQNRRAGMVAGARELTGTVAEHLGVQAGTPAAGANMRRASALRNSVALHELYFGGLRRGAGDAGPGELFRRLASDAHGSPEAWAGDMRACVQAADGWALTCWDPARGLRNFVVDGHDRGVPAGLPILLAIDTWEHAYFADVGAKKHLYAASLWKNLDWDVVGTRLERVVAAPLVSPIMVPAT